VPYLADPSEVVLLPGAAAALAHAVSHHAKLFLHTNQSGIGRGYFNLQQAAACNDRLVALLKLGPAPFERICIAPEAPDSPSVYRKPSPAFAEEIMHAYGFAPEEICYIGDRGSDLATAAAASTRGVGVATGLDDLRAELHTLGLAGRFPVFDSLGDAIRYLFATP
jgi:D-glycero-D-manno-heptose 1,7-bisphosphate phosphatase